MFIHFYVFIYLYKFLEKTFLVLVYSFNKHLLFSFCLETDLHYQPYLKTIKDPSRFLLEPLRQSTEKQQALITVIAH